MGSLTSWVSDAVGSFTMQPLHGGQGPWRIRAAGGDLVLRAPTPRIEAAMIRTGFAALELAERHGIPAPRLVAADLDGHAATLETFLPSRPWPRRLSLARLTAAGQTLARVHAVPLSPSPDLPLRPRPIAVDDFASDRREGRLPTTPLLSAADARIRSLTPPDTPPVFLHGDVWPGNLPWTTPRQCTLIDWKTAGTGDPGVDLGELRKQIAITYGDLDPLPTITTAWEQLSARRATNTPYWDAVAALNTPTNLYNPTATHRRDTFLRAALADL
jgi:aminoglycoside phosphotransferase (APT) family kinase protein